MIEATCSRCPTCSGELPVDAPQGLCPKCLMRLGLGTGAAPEATASLPATRAGTARFDPPRPAELALRFPELEVVELVGRGGMGAVYLARQPRLNRRVALKLLAPELAGDPAFLDRFAREAQALARLSHPHIVTVFDFGSREGLPYLLMEYVDGMNLRQLGRAGRLSPREALALVPQICDALQYAHDEGVVHRDIKPENILIDERGRVKIADFGLAKILRRKPGDVTLTAAGDVMGTVHYMAPEQLERPLEVDHRADIYALGVVFYEMLTGELPLGRFAPPSKKAEVDAGVDDVVLRALARDPADRYQQVRDVKTDIERITRSVAAQTVVRSDVGAAAVASSGIGSPASASAAEVEVERVVLSHLPHDRIQAIRAVRESDGVATLGEAMGRVDEIARKHGITLPQVRVSFRDSIGVWLRVFAVPCLVGLAVYWLLQSTDVSRWLGWTLFLAGFGLWQAYLAWRHRGTTPGWGAALQAHIVGMFVLSHLASLVRPVLEWIQRTAGATPGRHDVLVLQGLFLLAVLWSMRQAFRYARLSAWDTRTLQVLHSSFLAKPHEIAAVELSPARLRSGRICLVVLAILSVVSYFGILVFGK